LPSSLIALLICFTLSSVAALGADSATKKTGDGEPDVLSYIKGRQKVLEGAFEEAAPLLEKALKLDPESAKISHELSEVYLRLANLDKAEALGRKAVDKEPNNIDYRLTLGGIFASQKKYNEAREQYKKIGELEPANQKVPLLLGILEAENGQLEEGVKILSKAVEANPDSIMGYFYRAKIYLEMEQVDKGKADLDKCLTLRPSFVEAGTALGMLYERLGDIDKAIEAYSRIQANGRYRKRLAQLYLSKNEFEKALEEFIEYEKLEPDDYSVAVKIGLIYFELKKFPDAVTRFQQILKEQPEAGNVRFYLGVVLEELKQSERALAEFKKVPVDSSFYKEAMLHVGFILKEQNRYKEGAEFSKKVLAANADVVEFYDMHASFFEVQKNYKTALGIIQNGLKKYPADEKLLYFEGALYEKMGEREKSIANMRKIIAQNESNAHALNFLGYTLAESGENLDEAEGFIQKALTLRPDDPYIQDSLAWVMYKKGKVDEALEKLLKIVEKQADEAVIYEHLGDIYSKKRDSVKAIEMYKKAATLSSQKKDKDTAKKIEGKIASLEKDRRRPTND